MAYIGKPSFVDSVPSHTRTVRDVEPVHPEVPIDGTVRLLNEKLNELDGTLANIRSKLFGDGTPVGDPRCGKDATCISRGLEDATSALDDCLANANTINNRLG